VTDTIVDELPRPYGHKVRFDPTINLGHILTASVFLLSGAAAFFNLSARVDRQQDKTAQIEVYFKEKMASVENQQTRFDLNYREDMREIKTMLSKIDDKLDKKMDKPR